VQEVSQTTSSGIQALKCLDPKQKHVQIVLADGFEEIEAIAVIDILRRAGIHIEIMGLQKKEIFSARGLQVGTDTTLTQLPDSIPDMLVLPGGEPGTSHLEESPIVRQMILRQDQSQKWIAAICAAPRILAGLGLLKGRKATSFPGVQARMGDCLYSEDPVVICDHIITSRGAGTALAFAYTMVALLISPDLSQKLQAEMVYLP
jgi:4-methyl-5(b-hydroxyethyl)-thiazole monophosphate biosynthesis